MSLRGDEYRSGQVGWGLALVAIPKPKDAEATIDSGCECPSFWPALESAVGL